MKNIDWPLLILLAIVFVVMSYARWQWFKARMSRKDRKRTNEKGD